MKKTTYECKKCGKTCNGGGVSFIVVEGVGIATIIMSDKMDEFREHACGEEHAVQVLADAVRKIKGGEPTGKPESEVGA